MTAVEPWSITKAQEWYKQQGFLCGANFLPSTAINQLEMWQAETWDAQTIDKELGWASQIGMNVMRVYLHDLLWKGNGEDLFSRMDEFLAIAHSHGIRILFVIFDDCWNQNPQTGTQPNPLPFVHNSGWVQSPGVAKVNDPSTWAPLEAYVKGVLNHFKDDERILGWDLYNEPGNGTSGDASMGEDKQGARSLPLLKKVFCWAREVDGLTQPITAGLWIEQEEWTEINAFLLSQSDILTFHSYDPPIKMLERAERVRAQRKGYPLICTEYMGRTAGSTFRYNMSVLKNNDIGAINWGLVSGKSQTIYPWGWSEKKGTPPLYFHDVFHSDGRFLYPSEEKDILAITGKGAEKK